jgi:hypothetical protein
MITNFPRDKKGKILPPDDSILEDVSFPLHPPIMNHGNVIDVPRLLSKLLWGDEDHIEWGSIQNNNDYKF